MSELLSHNPERKRRTIFNENFLVERSHKILVNPDLPFRMQKRQLLEKLGFPSDPSLRAFSIQNTSGINRTFDQYLQRPPFLIITSEKPMRSRIPPLFMIRSGSQIIYRDSSGQKQEISRQNILPIVTSYSKDSWVEFARPLWRPNVLAGRLLYLNQSRQILEVQRGVDPHVLGYSRNITYFKGELHFFDPKFQPNDSIVADPSFGKFNRAVNESGFLSGKIERLCQDLAHFSDSFEELRHIAPYATVEFAYTSKNDLIVIDVDWPAQWEVQNG